ncbi:MAG: RdgB/HAM1 family non-canonical purine NTP pyrophosphatase [Mailhella sp.]|nr:RdgB/HAM1 family non-canonical purine NTP pyrophosphatase [Mailhella sp.]
MEKIVIASKNKGKIAEMRPVLENLGFEVCSLPDDFPEIAEEGGSFIENALIKASTAADALGMPAVADDSGLCVDVLEGAPGIYSARFSNDTEPLPGETADERNNRKLLKVLEGVEDRAAAYFCAMALVYPEGSKHLPIIGKGTWEGEILKAPRGSNGFGYDPVFLDPELGLTGGEMTFEQKNARSHRAKALASLAGQLRLERETV